MDYEACHTAPESQGATLRSRQLSARIISFLEPETRSRIRKNADHTQPFSGGASPRANLPRKPTQAIPTTNDNFPTPNHHSGLTAHASVHPSIHGA